MGSYGLAILLVCLCSFSELTFAGSLYSKKMPQHHLKDDDKDGVINMRDKCADTPINAAIDNYGCHKSNSKLLSIELNILFVSNRYEVPSIYYDEVKKLASFMRDNPGSSVIIEGHTDDIGNERLNQRLSKNRAQAIATILINTFRIAKSRVQAIGYGEARPIASNDTIEGKTKNRRVVAEIFAQSTVDISKWDIYSVDRRN